MLSTKEVIKILKKFIIKALKYYWRDYQLVYAVHEDTDNLHIHVGINSVSNDGMKFSVRAEDMKAFRKRTDAVQFFQKFLNGKE